MVYFISTSTRVRQLKGLFPTSFQVKRQSQSSPTWATHLGNIFTPLVSAPGEPQRISPLGPQLVGKRCMWAASARAADSGLHTQRSVPSLVGTIDMAMSPCYRRRTWPKIQIQEANYNGHLAIDNFRGWFDSTNPIWELSPISTQIKVFFNKQKRHPPIDVCLIWLMSKMSHSCEHHSQAIFISHW